MNLYMLKKNDGQGLIEYVFLIALITIGILLALKLYGISVYDAYCYVGDKISGSEACKPTELCKDDFSTDLTGWKALQGNNMGVVNGGTLCPSSYTLMLNACSVSEPLTDYVVTLSDANLKSGSGYGIAFRAQNTSTGMTGYVFQYDPGFSPGSFIIRKWVNGRELSTPIAVAKASGYSWYNTPRDIKIVIKGSTFTAYVDGKLVLTATDSTYATGGAGLRTWDSTIVCVDGFNIQYIP